MLYSIHWGFLLSNLWRCSSHIRTDSFKTKRPLFLKIYCIYFLGSSRSILNTLVRLCIKLPIVSAVFIYYGRSSDPYNLHRTHHPSMTPQPCLGITMTVYGFLLGALHQQARALHMPLQGWHWHTHTHTVTWIPGLCTHISHVISTLLVFDHYLFVACTITINFYSIQPIMAMTHFMMLMEVVWICASINVH